MSSLAQLEKRLRRRQRKRQPQGFSAVVMRSFSANDGYAVIATETPVPRYDESKGYIVQEVLLMEGCEFRSGRNQVPIVDSHDDKTVRNVFGSMRDLEINRATGELGGTPSFASDEESQVIAKRMQEGHITDFSITAMPLDGFYVKSGDNYTTSRGQVIEGPAKIVTRWEPHNASICTTGADSNSTVRRSYTTDLMERIERVDDSMKSTLATLGVPEGMEDQNQIIAFLAGKAQSDAPVALAEPVESMASEEESPMVENMEDDSKEPEAEETERMGTEEKEAVERSAVTKERNRAKEIYAACDQGKIERSFADELVNGGVTLSDARAKIIERMATSAVGQSVEGGEQPKVTESADDKFYDAARDGVLMRSYQQASLQGKPFANAAPGADDFKMAKLSRVAEAFAERMGAPVKRMTQPEIAMVAMGHPGTLNRFKIQRDAYHSTGSFSNLMLDAANKTLLAGYDEAEYTWSRWARQAPSVDDFKNINRIRYSEMQSPEVVAENKDYPEGKTSDAKESYVVEKYGNIFSVTWETVVNDDLDAISRTPAMQGAACRRKQNAVVYAVLTANANLADGGALFNSTAQTTDGGHDNLASSGAAISVASLNSAFVKMMTKKGLGSSGTDSDAILNIQPRFLIVPVAISATALQQVASIADPSAGGSNAGNSNTNNIYGPNGQRPLEVIVEPVLDGNSATAWYLAAANSQVDTVELSFLSGEESPVLESEWDFNKDIYKYKVRQTFGAKAIDFRGLYKNPGA